MNGRRKLWLALLIAIVFAFGVCAVAACDFSNPRNPTDPSIVPLNSEYVISDGHYTAGIDLPVGTCNVSVVSGNGNVSSSNMFSGGINAIMGTSDDDMYIQSFNGLRMNRNVVLSVSNGVTVKLTYTAISDSFTNRWQDESGLVTLSDGNYTVGTDILSGVYDIIVVSGNGNVSSSNMFSGGINAIMGLEGEDMYIREFKNCELNSGDVLTIANGLTVNLIPVYNN